MATVPLDRSPERRAAVLAGLLAPVSTLDVYELIAAALTELDRRCEALTPRYSTAVNGRTATVEYREDLDRWGSVLHADVDPDEGYTIPASLELMVGITATTVPVNALGVRVTR